MASPDIGAHPGFPNARFALGYGGITFSVLVAEIIRDLCLRRANPDAHVFHFGR